MDLVRDMLDKKVVDRNGRDMGRVDSIILRIDGGEAPSVLALELGPAVLVLECDRCSGDGLRHWNMGSGSTKGDPPGSRSRTSSTCTI